MIGRLLLLCLGISLSSSAQFFADGFFKAKGERSLGVSGFYQQSENYLAGKQNLQLPRQLGGLTLFGDFGWTSYTNYLIQIPFINGRPQDIELGIKVKPMELKNSRLNWILYAGLQFPVIPYPTETQNAIGQMARNLYASTMFQYQWESGWFSMLQAGHKLSLEPVPHALFGQVKTGKAGAKWYFDVGLQWQYSPGGKDYRGQGELAAENFRELGVSYIKGNYSIYRPFGKKGWGLSFSQWYTFAGRNTGIQELGLSLGIIHSRY